MHRVIAGGTGFIGKYLTEKWLAAGHEVTIIGRSKQKIKDCYGDAVTPVEWDDLADDDQSILQHAQIVVNLCGVNIGEKSWTPQRKEEILTSRTHYTKLLSETCAKLSDHAPPLFNASAIGVYGLQESESHGLPIPYDETEPFDYQEAPDFLAKVARQWELKTNPAKAHGVRVVNLRFGIVLGANGGVLKKLITPFKFGLGGPIGNGQQPFSWIHIEDLADAIEFLIQKKYIRGPVNLVSPLGITQKQFAKALGKAIHRPSIIPTPGIVLKMVFGQMADELLLRGQHVAPKILTDAEFEFKYPTIDKALDNIFQPNPCG